MLTIDPTSRTDVTTILEHPFLQLYRWPDWEQMPDQASLDAAKDNLRLYDTKTMGVREWRGEYSLLLLEKFLNLSEINPDIEHGFKTVMFKPMLLLDNSCLLLREGV